MKCLWKLLLAGCLVPVALQLLGSKQPAVRVESMDSVGPRVLERQTQASVIRDYLQAWQTLGRALAENRADALDEYFVGVAKDKLADTIREQQNLGIQTTYRDQTHDLKVTFYSPEGLSVQLLDAVEYDVQILDRGHVVGSQHVRSRYIAVLTPAEAKWKVRLFQAQPETQSE